MTDDFYKWHDVDVELPKKTDAYLCIVRYFSNNRYDYRILDYIENYGFNLYGLENSGILEVRLWTGIRPNPLF